MVHSQVHHATGASGRGSSSPPRERQQINEKGGRVVQAHLLERDRQHKQRGPHQFAARENRADRSHHQTQTNAIVPETEKVSTIHRARMYALEMPMVDENEGRMKQNEGATSGLTRRIVSVTMQPIQRHTLTKR